MEALVTHASAARTVEATRWCAVGALLALVVLGVAWELWLAPTGSGLLALKVVPLCFALPGLLRRRLYTYRWVSLLVWPYFTEGIVRWGDAGHAAALARTEVALCVVLFAACAIHVRTRLKKA